MREILFVHADGRMSVDNVVGLADTLKAVAMGDEDAELAQLWVVRGLTFPSLVRLIHANYSAAEQDAPPCYWTHAVTRDGYRHVEVAVRFPSGLVERSHYAIDMRG